MSENNRFDIKLLDILVCPVCKGNLEHLKDKNLLLCNKCKISFEIKKGIPDLVPSHSKSL